MLIKLDELSDHLSFLLRLIFENFARLKPR